MYLVTIFGNLLIILVIITDSHLHTPMYFFLSNLSLCDICLSSTTVPKMLVNIQAQSSVITYTGCVTQMYFFMIFVGLDDFLLAVMAYDRFVAICHPLHYTAIMNPQICVLMILGSWVTVVSLFYCTSIGVYLSSAASHNTHSGASASVMYTVITPMLNPFIYSLRNKDIRGALNKCFGGTLSFCTNVEVLPEVLKIASSDILLNNLLVYFVAIVSGIPPVIGILFSYSKIVSSILRISSAGVKYKAFSTCGCHLSVDSLFYGTGTGVYLSFEIIPSSRKNLVASVICALVTPMLNPSSTARGAGI
nr:olfactory receptor-like protein OLF4 [Dasypus novemcinctus]